MVLAQCIGVGPNCGPYTTGSGAAAPAPRAFDAEVPGLGVRWMGWPAPRSVPKKGV
jgi:hypothetical protein